MAQPGQPTREQLAFIAAQNAEAQRQLNEEAERRNIPVAELVKEKERKFLEFCKAQGKEPEEVKKELIMKRQNQMMQATGEQQQKGPQTQRVAVSPGQPVDPKALAVAKFLRSQALKPRTCILDGERKDMFKGMQPTQQNPLKPSDQIRPGY
jgi:translocation protein SEC62